MDVTVIVVRNGYDEPSVKKKTPDEAVCVLFRPNNP